MELKELMNRENELEERLVLFTGRFAGMSPSNLRDELRTLASSMLEHAEALKNFMNDEEKEDV